MQSEEESTRGVLFWIYEEEEEKQVRSWLGTRQVSNWPMFFGSVYLGTHSLRHSADLCCASGHQTRTCCPKKPNRRRSDVTRETAARDQIIEG